MDGRCSAVTLLVILLAACKDSPPVEPIPVQVTVAPTNVEVVAGAEQSFAAAVSGADNGAVEWGASGGEVLEASGTTLVWRAPLEPGAYTITATSIADSTARATATAEIRELDGASSIDFAGYRGTEETLPAGMFVTGENTAGAVAGAGFDPFTGVHDLSATEPPSFDGFGAFTNGKGHYAFGIRERGEADLREARLFLAYRNDDERHIVGFDIAYDVEVWRLGERANRIRLKFGLDTVGYSTLPDLASSVNPRGTASGEDVGRIVDGTLEENRTRVSVRIDLGRPIGPDGATFGSLAPGETGYFRWQYSNADGDEGSERSALALSRLRIVPIFTDGEPPERDIPVDPVNPLSFSHEAGFYTEPFALELSTEIEGATIYYTIDDSVPDPSRVMNDKMYEAIPVEERMRTFVYDGPIDLAEALARPAEISMIPTTAPDWTSPWREPVGDVQKVAVIRVIVVDQNQVRESATNTYLIDAAGRARYSLPVVSLATDRDGFFGSKRGIYVPGTTGANFSERGREWERVAHLEYFDLAGGRPLAQTVGVRLHGGHTRQMPIKGLRLYARSEYGTSHLRYRFFGSKPIDEYKRILLRPSGNDWRQSLIRDATIQTLVEHLGFETQHHSPAIVFINGEYWGIHNLRDRLDEWHLETHHGVPRNQVVILSRNMILETGEPGDERAYREFMNEVRSGTLSSRAAFDARMDVDGYLDYVIAQMYAGNTDWPHNNVAYWRYKGEPDPAGGMRDGRWRWLMYDMDRSFNRPGTGVDFDMVRHLLVSGESPWARELIRGIVAVPELRHELIQRIAVHTATTFRPTWVRDHVSRIAALIELEVKENLRRWNPQRPEAYWTWHINQMLAFADQRPAHFRDHVAAHFDEVTGTAELEISGLGGPGTVRLYSVPLKARWPGVELVDGIWRGEMFTGVPVVLSAEEVDLSLAEVTGAVEQVEQRKGALRFVMTGPVRVEVR